MRLLGGLEKGVCGTEFQFYLKCVHWVVAEFSIQFDFVLEKI